MGEMLPNNIDATLQQRLLLLVYNIEIKHMLIESFLYNLPYIQ